MKVFLCALFTLLVIACAKEAKPEMKETMEAAPAATEMATDSMAVDSAAMMKEEDDASDEDSSK